MTSHVHLFIYASHLLLKGLKKHNQQLLYQAKMQLTIVFFTHILLIWLPVLEIELSAMYLEICLLPSVETRQPLEIIQFYYSFQNVPSYLPKHTGLSSSYHPPIQLSIYPFLSHTTVVYISCPPS